MKEIKIMVRADFAGDVALWIFIITYIYISFCIYIYIFLIIIRGPLLDCLSRVSTSWLRSGALYYLRIVRDVCSGFPSLDFSRLVRREWASFSFSPSSSRLRLRPLLIIFDIFVSFARLAGISRDEDGRSNRSQSPRLYLVTVSFTLLARFFRVCFICSRARSSFIASRLCANALCLYAFTPAVSSPSSPS